MFAQNYVINSLLIQEKLAEHKALLQQCPDKRTEIQGVEKTYHQ
jgi:hypothetical protein